MVYLKWKPCAEELKKQKEELEEIIRRFHRGQKIELSGWITITETVLERCFSADDRHLKQFKQLNHGRVPLNPREVATSYLRLIDAYIQEIERGLLLDEAAPIEDESSSKKPSPMDVFIVHGHAEAIVDEVAIFIDNLGFNPRIFKREPDRGNTIIEKLERISSEVSFAVVILTGDDLGGERSISSYEQLQKISRRLRGILIELGVAKVLKSNTSSVQGILNQAASIIEKLEPRARQNVIFELGFFFGLLGRDNVCVLYENGVELPSDVQGLMYKPLDEEANWKAELERELIDWRQRMADQVST